MPSNRDYVQILLKNRPCILCMLVINMFSCNKENMRQAGALPATGCVT